MKGFTPRQLRKLATPLEPTKIKTRIADGKTLAYLEGWFVLQEANRIFGYDGWDREMVASERTFVRRTGDAVSCGYSARVRIRVRVQDQAVLREGTGFGTATAQEIGDAHERAIKAAETDATKRALATFGGRFGLLLYAQGSERASERVFGHIISPPEAHAPFPLVACDGAVLTAGSPEGFCTGLRQLVEVADTAAQINALREQNKVSLARLRTITGLQTDRGEHYADVLQRLCEARLRLIQTRDAHTRQTVKDIVSPPSQRGRDHIPIPPYPLATLRQRLGTQMPEKAATLSSAPPGVSATLPTGETAMTSETHADARASRATAAASTRTDSAAEPLTRRSQISGGFTIDKSALALPSDRRLRSKAHLVAVASQACLICEETPSHAHHITFAQPRGLSRKVSDEFTVPLCAVHHNALHLSGNESGWWRSQDIDPLPEARRLWLLSHGEILSASASTSAVDAHE